MHPRPRIRRVVKWGGTAAATLLALMLIGSRWWCFMWDTPGGGYVAIQAGRICFAEPVFSHWREGSGSSYLEPLSSPLRWSPSWGRWNLGGYLAVPIWAPMVIASFVAATAWRREMVMRRLQQDCCCRFCRYDRSGLQSTAPCPECGMPGPG